MVRREMLRLLDTVAGETFGDVGTGVFPPRTSPRTTTTSTCGPNSRGLSRTNSPSRRSGTACHWLASGNIEREHERVSYHRKERAEGSFNRTVTLPTEVDEERVDARYADGILTITLPKAEEAKPRQIAVRT